LVKNRWFTHLDHTTPFNIFAVTPGRHKNTPSPLVETPTKVLRSADSRRRWRLLLHIFSAFINNADNFGRCPVRDVNVVVKMHRDPRYRPVKKIKNNVPVVS
jgi:hypothetical protein